MSAASLEAISAARQLVARFNDAINRSDFAAYHDLWTPEGILDLRGLPDIAGPIKGAQAIVNAIKPMRESWEFFFQMTGEVYVEQDGDIIVARSPMWEFGRTAEGKGYSAHSINVDEITQTPEGWRLARRIWYGVLINNDNLPGTSIPLPTDLRS